MSIDSRPLDFAVVDDVGFAAKRGRLRDLPTSVQFVARRIGPLLEVRHLQASGLLPQGNLSWLEPGSLDALDRALGAGNGRWSEPAQRATGYLKIRAQAASDGWISFAMDAKRAARDAGLSSEWAGQMVAAIREMEDNVREHSGAVETGYVAFHSAPGTFEFVVADHGVGVLATLRGAPEYKNLTDHGEALRLTLQEGASRYGFGEGRGYGFRPLFTGLANRQAALRFRSGEASLTIDGLSPTLPKAQLAMKASLDGLFISVTCKASLN